MATSSTYRYSLERYSGPTSRYTCPECGRKRSFTRYVDNASQTHLADHVGKCERLNNCGYHFTPSQHFAAGGERPSAEWTPPPTAPELTGFRMNSSHFEYTLGHEKSNNLLNYLCTRMTAEDVHRVAAEYGVGTWPERGKLEGASVFWQRDGHGDLRTAKVIQYGPEGHRVKGAQHWAHAIAGSMPDGFRLDQCLFGEHLLPIYPDAPVGIVEAEKTALIARMKVPEVLWVATGGLLDLKLSKVLPLSGRNVTLWPDLGAGYEHWLAKAEDMTPLFASLQVTDILERIATPEEREKGLDLADYLLNQGASE